MVYAFASIYVPNAKPFFYPTRCTRIISAEGSMDFLLGSTIFIIGRTTKMSYFKSSFISRLHIKLLNYVFFMHLLVSEEHVSYKYIKQNVI